MCAKYYLMGCHRVNWLKSELCFILFYPNCVVIDIVNKKDFKAKIKHIKSQTKVKKASIFIKPILINEALENYGKSIAMMNENKVYNLNKKNKLIYNSQIKKIFYHAKRIDISSESCISKTGTLVIKSNENNITLYHDYCEKTLLEIQVLNAIS